MNTLSARDMTSQAHVTRYTIRAGIIASVGLAQVYLSLFMLGMKSTALAPAAVREICHTPLTQPELRIKSGAFYLRCGTPGLEGLWRIEKYNQALPGTGIRAPAISFINATI
jgi:hypothetical protein